MNKIIIPALPRPTLKELQAKYTWIKKIERDTSETKSVELSLISVLKDGETSIDGKKYEKRLPKKLLGFQHLEWLVEHQGEFPELLEQAKKENFWYIDFSGLVVVYEDGDRRVPYGARFGERWGARWHWLDNRFLQDGRVAVSGGRKFKSSRDLDSLGLIKRVEELESKMSKIEKFLII